MTSYLPGVEYGQLHYSSLEKCKNLALKYNGFNFDRKVLINHETQQDIIWWESNVRTECTTLEKGNPTIDLFTDSSSVGWGAVRRENKTGGSWSTEEQKMHINALEMKAILFGLQALCADTFDAHIKVHSDSFTSVCYVNAKGGTKSEECNSIAKEVWAWCLGRKNFITATHVAGTENTEANYESRNHDTNTEWSLNARVFYKIVERLGKPTIDLFASHQNYKVPRFISWKPDPQAIGINTFQQQVKNEIFYAFPPFSLITKFVKKVETEKLEGILIAPEWSTQTYYPLLSRLLINIPIALKWRASLLTHPNSGHPHPLGSKLKLRAFHLSTNPLKRKGFHQELQKLCYKDGENLQQTSTKFTLKNGKLIVNKSKSVSFPVI